MICMFVAGPDAAAQPVLAFAAGDALASAGAAAAAADARRQQPGGRPSAAWVHVRYADDATARAAVGSP